MASWGESLATSGGAISADAAQERALAEVTSYSDAHRCRRRTRASAHTPAGNRSRARQGGQTGKHLDFFIQELHREANTPGSKSGALELSRIGVDMKVLIKQMHEQVQNLE